MIGLLFASFGVTLLTVSMPMGAISDRIGRKPPIIGGLLALAAASVLFAYADSLPWLFAARLVQGASDAVTWVVGFALIADLYRPEERGRVMGLVMSGTNLAFMVGPTIGGWLYETGGIRLPFLFVAALALVGAAAFVWLDVPDKQSVRETVPVKTVMRVPAVAACFAAVIISSATVSMLEPVLPLYLTATLGIGPARVGYLFGIGAVASTVLNPVYGGMVNRVGSRQMMMIGLVLVAGLLPLLSLAKSYPLRDRLLRGVRRGDLVDHHALARLHGRSDVERRREVVRRRLRLVQHGVGAGAARGPGAQRLPVRTHGLRLADAHLGAAAPQRGVAAEESTIAAPPIEEHA